MALQHEKTNRKAMHWLVRYARHCGLNFHGELPVELQLRSLFGPPAWRILCRSGRPPFVPILRNRDLAFADLVEYCQRLADRSFVKAPRAELLAYFIVQRRLHFDEPCRVPQGVDFAVMHIANQDPKIPTGELALVATWLPERGPDFAGKPRWSSLVRRSRQAQRLELATPQRPSGAWSFHCDDVAWRGHEIRPLRDSSALWLEGASMGSCLFKLRRLCSRSQPSRFFSVRRSGVRVATLELWWIRPEQTFTGMEAVLGRWCMRDLRLSFNRLPDAGLIESMTDFARMYTLWSHRLGRQQDTAFSPDRFRFSLDPVASGVPEALAAASPDPLAAAWPRPG
jgi:hypothetical protein